MTTPGQFVTEQFAAVKPSGTVDRAKGVVYGVRLVGPRSRNGRRYPAAVMERYKALYEGAAVNWGHFKKPNGAPADVPTDARFGRARNVRVEGDGLHADVHYNPHHPKAEAFAWAAENDPSFYALSHVARVGWSKARGPGGDRVAEVIYEVASVDVVADGGSNATIFEDASAMTVDVTSIASEIGTAADLTEFIKSLLAAVTLADADKLSAVEEALDTLVPGDPPADPSADPAATAAVVESLSRRGKLGQWAAEQLGDSFAREALAVRESWVREQCAAAGLPDAAMTDVFVTTVMESANDRVPALIADRKAAFPGTGKAPPVVPPKVNKTSVPGPGTKKSVKDLVAEADWG